MRIFCKRGRKFTRRVEDEASNRPSCMIITFNHVHSTVIVLHRVDKEALPADKNAFKPCRVENYRLCIDDDDMSIILILN